MALAKHYLAKDCQVYGCSRGEQGISHPSYFHEQVDLTNEKEVTRWIKNIKRKVKSFDVLLCSAAIAPADRLGIATDGNLMKDTFETNYFGTFYVIREVSKVMLQQKYGRVITFSSMAAGLHDKGASVYASSKQAVVETTKIFAKELAKYNVTFNTIAPSIVDTEMSSKLGKDILEKAMNRLDIKRMISMDEICHTTDFLIDPRTAFITGQTLYLGLVC